MPPFSLSFIAILIVSKNVFVTVVLSPLPFLDRCDCVLRVPLPFSRSNLSFSLSLSLSLSLAHPAYYVQARRNSPLRRRRHCCRCRHLNRRYRGKKKEKGEEEEEEEKKEEEEVEEFQRAMPAERISQAGREGRKKGRQTGTYVH